MITVAVGYFPYQAVVQTQGTPENSHHIGTRQADVRCRGRIFSCGKSLPPLVFPAALNLSKLHMMDDGRTTVGNPVP